MDKEILQKATFIKIGRTVKELRETNGITQEKLAEYLKISRSSIQRIERGAYGIKITEIVMLMDLFKVSADYIFGIVDNETVQTTNLENEIVERLKKKRMRCKMITVLLIEDDQNAIKLITETIEIFNEYGNSSVKFDIAVVNDSQSAQNVLESKVFDVFIIDIDLPGSDGILLAEQIRIEYPETFIIFQSSIKNPQIIEYALSQLNAIEFLEKPYTMRKLINTLIRVVKAR